MTCKLNKGWYFLMAQPQQCCPLNRLPGITSQKLDLNLHHKAYLDPAQYPGGEHEYKYTFIHVLTWEANCSILGQFLFADITGYLKLVGCPGLATGFRIHLFLRFYHPCFVHIAILFKLSSNIKWIDIGRYYYTGNAVLFKALIHQLGPFSICLICSSLVIRSTSAFINLVDLLFTQDNPVKPASRSVFCRSGSSPSFLILTVEP